MARTIQKRKRSDGPMRFVKRRRFIRRRRFKRGTTSSYSTRSTGASGAWRFRGRKVSKRVWRRRLYRHTDFPTHYSSINSTLNTVTTPAAITDCQAAILPCFPVTSSTIGLAFWKADVTINQNLQLSEIVGPNLTGPKWGQLGEADPISCIIRGGRYYININCNAGNDPINFRVQLAFAKQQQRDAAGNVGNTLTAWINAINAINPKPLTWTYNQQADYNQYFYPPILDKSGRLLPGEDMSIVKSIKPVKIDCAQHRDQGGWYPYWFVYASQSATNVAGAPVVGFVTGYNISFVAFELIEEA